MASTQRQGLTTSVRGWDCSNFCNLATVRPWQGLVHQRQVSHYSVVQPTSDVSATVLEIQRESGRNRLRDAQSSLDNVVPNIAARSQKPQGYAETFLGMCESLAAKLACARDIMKSGKFAGPQTCGWTASRGRCGRPGQRGLETCVPFGRWPLSCKPCQATAFAFIRRCARLQALCCMVLLACLTQPFGMCARPAHSSRANSRFTN